MNLEELKTQVNKFIELKKSIDAASALKDELGFSNPNSDEHNKSFKEWIDKKKEYYNNTDSMMECIKHLWGIVEKK